MTRDSLDPAQEPLDLALLRSFLAVVDARTVTEAARRLGLTQPAVSKQLGALERRFATRLLHRDGRGVRPTQAGLVLAERARGIVRRLEALETGRLPAPDRRVVRIGLSPTIADMVVVPLLRAVARNLPDVRLAVSDGFSGHVADWLVAGEIDVGVLYAATGARGLATVATFGEPLHLVVPVGHPAAAAGRVALEDLAGLEFVLPGRPHGLRLTAERLFRSHGVPLGIGYEIASFSTMRRLVCEGLAVTILPWHSIAADVAAGRVRTVEVEGMPMARALVVAVSGLGERPAWVDAVAGEVAAVLDRELARVEAERRTVGP